jgi:hypothetical protein
LLERSTHDRLGIQAHPPLQEGGVGAAEVIVEVEVAFHEFPRLQGRILAVQSTLHRIADDEGVTARAMVGPRAVVMHAPAEFGEHKEHHIVGGIVLFEVIVEGTDRLRRLGPQSGVVRQLPGVGIKAVIRGRGVKYAGPQSRRCPSQSIDWKELPATRSFFQWHRSAIGFDRSAPAS